MPAFFAERHKGRLFFQADHLEIEAGTAKWRRGQALAGGGRRRGAELGLAGCLHPSPRVGLLRLLGLRRTWARAPCALSGEVRVATRVSSVSSDKRTVTSPKPFYVLLISRGKNLKSGISSSFGGQLWCNRPFCVSAGIPHLGYNLQNK